MISRDPAFIVSVARTSVSSCRACENIPTSGPLIITPNHQTYADPALVSIPVRRRVYYMAWDRLFEIPVFSWMIRRLRAFPVRIDSADPSSTREAVRLLTAGHVLMIFPEGERTLTGRVERFKLGAFRLAATFRRSGAPGHDRRRLRSVATRPSASAAGTDLDHLPSTVEARSHARAAPSRQRPGPARADHHRGLARRERARAGRLTSAAALLDPVSRLDQALLHDLDLLTPRCLERELDAALADRRA